MHTIEEQDDPEGDQMFKYQQNVKALVLQVSVRPYSLYL